MLIYSSAHSKNALFDAVTAHQPQSLAAQPAKISVSPKISVSHSRLMLNRLVAFTALISINACTYFAAQALLSA